MNDLMRQLYLSGIADPLSQSISEIADYLINYGD